MGDISTGDLGTRLFLSLAWATHQQPRPQAPGAAQNQEEQVWQVFKTRCLRAQDGACLQGLLGNVVQRAQGDEDMNSRGRCPTLTQRPPVSARTRP